MSAFTLGAASLETVAMLSLLAIASGVAGWLDLRYRRLPNWLCAVTAISGLLTAAFHGGGNLGIVGSHGLHMLLALLAGMILFRFGVFGGGDAKFYAAVAAWFPLAEAVRLLVMVALSGLLLLVCWFAYRRFKGYPIRQRSNDAFDGLPYGVAIGLGAIAAILA